MLYESEVALQDMSLLFDKKNKDGRTDRHNFFVTRSLQRKDAFNYRNMKSVTLSYANQTLSTGINFSRNE